MVHYYTVLIITCISAYKQSDEIIRISSGNYYFYPEKNAIHEKIDPLGQKTG